MTDPDVAALFAQAMGRHQLGRLAEAKTLYEFVLAHHPKHFDALHMLGVLAVQTGQTAAGVAMIRRAIAVNDRVPVAYANLGMGLHSLKHHAQALAAYDRAIALQPDFADAYHSRAGILLALDRPEDALASYDRAIALNAAHAEAHHNRGVVLLQLKRHVDALAAFDQAIASRTDYAVAYNYRGVALAELNRQEDAVASYDKAIALRPDFAEAYYNRAGVQVSLRRHLDAVASYDNAIALNADYAEAHHNRGVALRELRRHKEALASYDKAIALKPDFVDAHLNRSLSLLAMGRLAEAWHPYEWRKKLDPPHGHRDYPQPVWRGAESLAGRTLFVHAEQGLGDTIQFCRYLTLLPEDTHIVLEAPQPLVRLLRGLRQTITVIGDTETPPPFDFHCPMLSLPLAHATSLETIPAQVPYLHADPAATDQWRNRLSGLPGFHVGLCWAGQSRDHLPAANEIDRRRSISLALYGPLASIPGVRFVSLQKGQPATQTATPPPGMTIHDWTRDLTDFAETAALIAALDLVISVDTSVAHLAGALGKPVWILNRFDMCWRWLTGRTDLPWYPTARLFNQPQPGGWDRVMAEVETALRQVIA